MTPPSALQRLVSLVLTALAAALFLTAGALRGSAAPPAEPRYPVWLVSNGFHTSIAVRPRDVPFAREISAPPATDELLIGWGSEKFYCGPASFAALCGAIFGTGPSVLHIIPVHGSLLKMFPHSDVIEFSLPPAAVRKLAEELDRSFRRDARGQLITVRPGYYPGSHFFASKEHFYFPQMCNMWVAEKMRGAGVPLFPPTAIWASALVWQARHFGQVEQTRRRPREGY